MINSKKFLELRKSKKMKTEHLAFDLGISISAIYSIENKPNHNPCISILLKYSKYFNVPLKSLVSLDDINLKT